MCKYLWISVIAIFGWSSCLARVSAAGNDTVRTVAGLLAIKKVDHVGADSVTFDILLDGHNFDRLYGLSHVYYPDSGSSDGVNGRMLMEDFVGGADDTPVITLYDFRGQSPTVFQVTDKLDVDDVRWQSNGVLLEANGKWYVYRRGKLSKVDSMPK